MSNHFVMQAICCSKVFKSLHEIVKKLQVADHIKIVNITFVLGTGHSSVTSQNKHYDLIMQQQLRNEILGKYMAS